MTKHLDAYLNDDLAGSVAALELIEHCQEQHKNEPLTTFFSRLKADIRADRHTLCDVMQSLEIDESAVRQTGAWAAEKVARARLKIAGDQPGLVLALEALIMGIVGKKMMWRSLAAAKLPNTSKFDFAKLQLRAGEQIEETELERVRAAQTAFAGAGDED